MVQNIAPFLERPNDYLLQLQTVDGRQELGCLKKGFWTWIKTHIGSWFGLFDPATVKLENIAKLVFDPIQKDDREKKKLCRILDYKLTRWMKAHPKERKIELLEPGRNIIPIRPQGKFFEWLDPNKRLAQVAKEVIEALPEGRFRSVNVGVVEDEGIEYRVIHIFPRFSTFQTNSPSIPEYQDLAKYLNGNFPEGKKQFDNLPRDGKELVFKFFRSEALNILFVKILVD